MCVWSCGAVELWNSVSNVVERREVIHRIGGVEIRKME